MLYKTHVLGGTLVGLSLSIGFDGVDAFIISCVGGIIGSLIPDIDAKNSFIAKTTYFFGKIVSRLAKHRGVFHTPFFYVLINLMVYGYFMKIPYDNRGCLGLFVFSLFLGEMSHLLLDSLNPFGIMFLWPFKKKRFRFLKITTGSKTEDIVSALLFSLCCLLFCLKNKMFL